MSATLERWHHGLVIGKFRPPHLGHGLVFRTALERVERLTVLVCADESDAISAELRATWLRELLPTAAIRVVETTGYDPDDSTLWAELTHRWLGRVPDVVFSSETYGEPFARALDCAHLAVDPGRSRFPISAAEVLERPLANLEYLEPCVRAYFVPRVALVGAESTGKTTLARALAAHYGTAWVPEYGRPYWEGLLTLPAIESTTDDFVHIAEAQQLMEDRLARHARRVLICDTDALTTWLWHERYLGGAAPAVRRLADARRYALYLLAGAEIPWEDDGTRDRSDERPWFQNRFREALRDRTEPVVTVEGPPEVRLARAIEAIDAVLAAGGDPLARCPSGA